MNLSDLGSAATISESILPVIENESKVRYAATTPSKTPRLHSSRKDCRPTLALGVSTSACSAMPAHALCALLFVEGKREVSFPTCSLWHWQWRGRTLLAMKAARFALMGDGCSSSAGMLVTYCSMIPRRRTFGRWPLASGAESAPIVRRVMQALVAEREENRAATSGAVPECWDRV